MSLVRRLVRPGARMASSLRVSGIGSPKDVISIGSSDAAAPMDGEVSVKLQVAPVLAADLKQVTGASFSKVGSVAGSFGIATVSQLGGKVAGLSVKDTVLVLGSGVWTGEATVSADSVMRVSSAKAAKELAVLPALLSAWALLGAFKTLKPDDVVVQSDGSTAVGQAVAQLAKARGVTLHSVTEKTIGALKLPSGAALCISNSSAMTRPLLHALGEGGVLVAYSDTAESLASTIGVDVSVSAAVFKKVAVHGFDLQTWLTAEPKQAADAMKEVCALFDAGKVAISAKKHTFGEAAAALQASAQGSLIALGV